MNSLGWRHFPSAPPANPDILSKLPDLSVSLLSDNMARLSGSIGLLPFHRIGSAWPERLSPYTHARETIS